MKTFLIWFFMSVFQGCTIFLGTILFFQEPFTNIVTITFSSLIVTELLNVYSSVVHLNWKMVCASVVTLFVYIFSIALLPEYFQTSYITWTFVVKVVCITLTSWFPLHFIQWIINKLDPSEF
jgi:phospholipid-translocating ATPase